MYSALHDYARNIERIFDEKLCDPNKDMLYFSLRLDTLSPWQESDFTEKERVSTVPGYEDMNHAHFMNYENTGMVQGTYLAALCFKYAVTKDPSDLEKARAIYQTICAVYDMSQKIAPGFFCKPWGAQTTDETSSDQYIYTLSGLDEYYPLASEEEKAKIREMVVSMVRFWLDHNYDWNYYGRPLHWIECRFISFMAFALSYGGGKEFADELDRLIAMQNETDNSPFRSTRKESLHILQDGTQQLNSCPESALSSFLSYEKAMKEGYNNEKIMQICIDCLKHGKDSVAEDGTVYSARVRASENEPFRELTVAETRYIRHEDSSPIFNLRGPFRKGGMQSIMFARFVLAFERYAPEYADRQWVKDLLLKTGEKHLTWFEDPLNIFPDEIRWMTNMFSGDAAAHYLWCYWKLRLEGEL